MVRPRTSPETTPILQLLSDYSFDVDTYAEAMVTGWLQRFEPAWVSQAITEALYQGRYKMVSVDHILQLWQRRGQPLRHFNREFESIILGQSWGQFLAATKASAAASNRDSESSSALFAADLSGEAIPQYHPHSPINAVDGQDSGHPFSIQPFGVDPSFESDPSATAHDSTRHPFPLAATDSFPTNGSQPEPSEGNPFFVGASSRTIPPLTPDQLARLTQPALAPELATTSALAQHPSHPPLDDRAAEALTAEALTDESLAAEVVEGEAKHLSLEENLKAAATGTTTTADAGSLAAIMAATNTAEDGTTTAMTTTDDSTEGLDPESEPIMVDTETAQVVIPNFQPVADLVSPPESAADSIPPFVPNPGPSDFHQRLKAVVEAGRQDN